MELIGRRSDRQRRIEAAWHVDGVEARDSPFDEPLPDLPRTPEDWVERSEAARYALKQYRGNMIKAPGYRLDLRNTDLQGLDLSGLNLRGCLLAGAQIQGANLVVAQMQGADLGVAHMQGAVLMNAHMQGANLGDAHMQGADLAGAQMQGAYLWDAQMQGAELWKAEMQGALLGRANITLARLASNDLSDVGLTADQFKTAFGDGSVILPHPLKAGEPPLEHWPTRELAFFPDKNGQTEYGRHYAAWRADPDAYDPEADY
ncbi:pentapeptide repeat-containing protein [Jannaschia aquimarina]|uniref:PipB2_1 protein n=1 Tax=Jannaschia aquimarina TaxID=935700 RepID=A0A0D1EIG0_9RHOB|nr:pentapeptide repeat-containing protein [Jannaschia aquimarina]KIT17389.1 Secreted effector protein pipB2 [Jannaschia aquimarina]SNS45997.1 Pentapeptide repeat-containing protein [Jannaschia aquimarina]